jgi:hypothetical protein
MPNDARPLRRDYDTQCMGVKTIHAASKAKGMPHPVGAENDEDGGRAPNDLLPFFACVFGAFKGEDEG